jgi:hypothetical protein
MECFGYTVIKTTELKSLQAKLQDLREASVNDTNWRELYEAGAKECSEMADRLAKILSSRRYARGKGK